MHYTFEDTKSSSGTADPTKTSAQEWMESMERAKDLALSQNMSGSYNSESYDLNSTVSSPNSTLHGNSVYPESYNTDRSSRTHLSKSQASLGGEEQMEKAMKKHRFSKRSSKNGLSSTPF
jgi:3-phosphoinositide dependent protein kinase-1